MFTFIFAVSNFITEFVVIELKRYFSEFKIINAIHPSSIPRSLFTQADSSLRPALFAAYIAIDTYHSDILRFVKDSVKKRIRELDEVSDTTDIVTSDSLRKALHFWENDTNPLHYNSLVKLIELVNPTETSLPPASETRLNVDEFSRFLINLADKGTVKGAPFLPDGKFQHVLPCAIKHIRRFASISSDGNEDEFAASLFKNAIDERKISFIPWSLPHQRRGQHPTTVSFYAWTSFGKKLSKRSQIVDVNTFRPEERHTAQREKVRDQLQATDQNAKWEAGKLRVDELHTILNKTVRPVDFTMPSFVSGNKWAITKETYDYVNERLDLTKTLHRLALLLAIIFSMLCPRVYMDYGSRDSPDLEHCDTARIYLNTIPWNSRQDAGKKGNMQRDIYIGMVTTYIVALYDKSSPIRRHFISSKGLGEGWTDKHSALFYH